MRFSDRTFGLLLILIITFNYIDAFSTLYWVSEGYAVEINPIMDFCMQISSEMFLFVKTLIVLVASFFLWYVRKNKLAHILILLAFLLYSYIFIIHCAAALKIFFN